MVRQLNCLRTCPSVLAHLSAMRGAIAGSDNDLHCEGSALAQNKVAGDDAPTERHPEKRMKAVYMAYEEKVLPELRKENPGMRLSQLKQLAFKNFQTAPENPKNQPHLDYNTK
ncbi:unnamed protein product [Dibothriocephalus latus]|uniref:Coiled-coil domain-containing protein n=1 Tax=Dibothriocephalus latus TaxID=60516 RepID=A0A3P7PEU1_DIBLA|nr:unnamed protein product [Dibothriocephalus latus]